MASQYVKLTAVAFQVDCPRCKETIPGPGGSLMWTREEIDLVQARGAHSVLTCPSCSRPFIIPPKY